MITVAQRPHGKEWSETGARIEFVVVTTEGELEDAVKAAVEAEAPATYLDFPISDIRALETATDSAGEPSIWDVVVEYGRPSSRLVPPVNTVVWSGTTAGGTQHITSGYGPSTVFTDPSVATLPADWGQVIGATRDEIEGLDITVPIFAFRAVKYVSQATWSTLRGIIFGLTGKVNDEAWEADGATFEAGEVLFLGGTWAKITDVDPPVYEVTFEFQASRNITIDDELTIGEITEIEKEGWDFLEVKYEDKEDTGQLYKKPIIVTIHKVYRRGAFGDLGL